MKRILIGSTALLAAGMIAGPAFADGAAMTAGNLDLSLGGDIDMTIHYQSKQPTKADTDRERNHALDLDGEMHFMGEAVTDAGLEFGFEVELEVAGAGAAAGGDMIDQNWIWVDGRFGKITLGGTDAVELDGNGDGETFSGVGKLTADTNGNEASSFGDTIDQYGEANKIIWEPPEMGDWQFAVNYTPDETTDTTGTTDNDDAGGEEKDLLIAAQYSGTIGDLDIGLDIAYATAGAEDETADTDIETNKRWRLGLEIESGDFTIGGFYKVFSEYAVDTTVTEDRQTVGVNIAYETGAWTVGASWIRATADEMTDATTKAGEDEATQTNFGVTYELNDDMEMNFGWEHSKWNDDASLAADENDADSIDIQFEWDVADGLEFDLGYQNFRYTHHDGLTTSASRTGHAITIFTEVTF